MAIEAIENAKEWFDGREPRERVALVIGAVAIVFALVWFQLWHPLRESLANAREDIAQKEQTIAWMKGAQAEIRRLRRTSGSSAQANSNQSLLAVTDQALGADGLKPSLKKSQRDGDSRVRVWLDNAEFDKVVKWLDRLSKQGISVVTMSVDDRSDVGRVNVRLTLERGAA